MTLEQPLIFDQWIGPALQGWAIAIAGLSLGGLFFAFLWLASLHGPIQAGDRIYGIIVSSLNDLFHISPRRVFALARLAVQESLRRLALIGLVVFAVILLFAVWFLDSETINPSALYLSFVLTAATYLVLLLSLFLSAFSLPNDIKNKTIYTIVTKPVRTPEIVLGRILGFVAIGTALLLVMGIANYIFVKRTLSHSHTLTAANLAPVGEATAGQKAGAARLEGRTSLESGHRHRVVVRGGKVTVESANGHSHDVTVNADGTYTVGPPVNQLTARMPMYGHLAFVDTDGKVKEKGINVGNEWLYRSYVEGGSENAAAVWKFQNVTPERFPNGIPIELTLRVYRSYKGDIEKGIPGSIVLRNPKNPRIKSAEQIFLCKEYTIDQQRIALKVPNSTRDKVLNVFEDLVEDGELEVVVQCLQHGQYYGAAAPDLYLLPRNATFEWNFIKAHIGIWLQMFLLTSYGVMLSTFLNGAVAMLATAGALTGGLYASFLSDLVSNKLEGGKSIESLYRIVTHKGVMGELEAGTGGILIQAGDMLLTAPMAIMSKLLPDFSSLSDIDYIAQGYNIPGDVILIHILTVVGYFIPLFVAGFLFLKVRELAK